MKSACLIAALALLPSAVAWAQASPAGRWKTIDDETGKVQSIVEITSTANGTLQGRVVEVVNSEKGPDPACDKCKGASAGKPIRGMTILWGLTPDGNDAWSGGTVLDPANGKTYRAKVRLKDGGAKLGMSGCIAFICREQTWLRD